ncbi:MAG TPA: ribosome small subunit-dependent GTPase A [Candidatus Saccharimonadales bacterium]|nr:ribosome small subunit-dependent GTPase A [Candidatus Saccharimonadales bacterium]
MPLRPESISPAPPSAPASAVPATLGWDTAWDETFATHADAGRRAARVIAVHKETAIVRSADGHDRPAGVTGRFRFEALAPSDYPAVGDWVALEPDAPSTGPDDQAVIAAVLPRRSAFVRSAADASRRTAGNLADEQVIAANVDIAFLVAGLDGDFNLRRLERYLAVAWSSGVTPVIVLNKADVARDLEDRLIAVESIAPGVPVVTVSALTGDHLADLAVHLTPGRTAVVLGSSGVGKSTLLNALLGEERQTTGAVRGSDSRGRHTTTHRELFVLPTGALLIDTPGIRSLEVAGADEGVETTFEDITDLAATCRFSDCRHEGEPGCAVREALLAGTLTQERLESQRKLERELAHVERKGDPRAMAEERRKWRIIHKTVDKQMDRKYGRER